MHYAGHSQSRAAGDAELFSGTIFDYPVQCSFFNPFITHAGASIPVTSVMPSKCVITTEKPPQIMNKYELDLGVTLVISKLCFFKFSSSVSWMSFLHTLEQSKDTVCII